MKSSLVKTDVLIIGAGMAGLRAALAAAEKGADVVVIGKGVSASPEVLGFNAVTGEPDSIECYFNDVRTSGKWINDPDVARRLVGDGAKEVRNLESLGMVFDKNPDGSYHVLHPLGCRYPRLVHYKSETGLAAMKLFRSRCTRLGVKIFDPVMALDIITEDKGVSGAVALDMKSGEYLSFMCKSIVLAAGGNGGIYGISTYPKGLDGGGYALAFRAGAELKDMEFQQYEPCCFVYPEELVGSLVPTTLLIAGAKLTNALGVAFLHKYGLTNENVQKNTLARAIIAEVQAGRGSDHGGVYYDLTGLPDELIIENYSIFYKPALEAGVDITKQPMEMAPAAHTCLGGVTIDANGKTSITGLYAAGEAAGGVHGANRIGGCAGAETLVFGAVSGDSAASRAKETEFGGSEESILKVTAEKERRAESLRRNKPGIDLKEIRREIGEVMMRNVGIFRSEQTLLYAENRLEEITGRLESLSVNSTKELADFYQCENALTTARIQCKASMLRKESRGVFSRTDYPERDDDNPYNVVVVKHGDSMNIKAVACGDKDAPKGKE